MNAGTNTVAVIGAGPAGVAASLALKDAGLRPLLIDRADRAGESWRRRYDRLELNTPRRFSHLPRRPYPKGTPMFPSRSQVAEHLERHAQEDGIDRLFETTVEGIDRQGDRWLLWTSAGKIHVRQVIVATGYESSPFIPSWKGLSAFEGELRHSSEYQNPEPYRGKSALVVGSGNSGMEIAFDLAEGGAGEVWLSVRTPPNIMLREGAASEVLASVLYHLPARVGDAVTRFGRRMSLGDLSEHGLPVPEEGVFSRLRRLGVVPAILDEEVIEPIKRGRVKVVAGVESLDAGGVRLADGAHVGPDAVICATGYRTGLEPLVGHLGVLDHRGVPRSHGPKTDAPALRFIGYVPRPAGIAYMGRDARRAAKAIKRELRRDSKGREPDAAAPERERTTASASARS